MRQFNYPNSQFTNILGGASIGWKLNVYDAGTTNYASIYSDLGQTVPTDNPVIADADGFLASFYWTGTIDVVLTDENNNLIDSASGIQDLVSTINAVVVAGNITLPFGDASGDGNTITTTLPITADFSDGGVFIVRANAANAGTINTPNLQINSYASRRIKKIGGSALVANDIVSGMNCLFVYHLAQDCYYLLNPNASYLNRDGTAKMLGALNMDSHKITGLTAGTGNGEAANYEQLSGDALRTFLVANATLANHAINKFLFDAKTGISTTTIPGIVEKATQSEMNAGTADVWPDSATIFNGFAQAADSFTLPTFLGGWKVKFGSKYVGDISGGEMTDTTSIIGFSSIKTVLVGSTSPNGNNSFVIHRKSFDDSSVTVLFRELVSEVQTNAGYWWCAIGTV